MVNSRVTSRQMRPPFARWLPLTSRRSISTMPRHWPITGRPTPSISIAAPAKRSSGETAIAEQFAALFKEQPELKLEVDCRRRFSSFRPTWPSSMAQPRLLAPNAEPEEIEYSAVDVKRDGKWLLDRVTDKSKEVIPTHYEQLKALEWMVGNWTDEADNAEVELDCNWTKNKNFLTRAFKISIDGQIDISRDAGHRLGSGREGDSLLDVRLQRHVSPRRPGSTAATAGSSAIAASLPDGRTATMINVMKQVDENSFTWQTIERTAGGELLPNIDEIQLVRR